MSRTEYVREALLNAVVSLEELAKAWPKDSLPPQPVALRMAEAINGGNAALAAAPAGEAEPVAWREITTEPRVREIGHLWLAADAAGKVFPGVFVGHRIPADAVKVLHIPDPIAPAPAAEGDSAFRRQEAAFIQGVSASALTLAEDLRAALATTAPGHLVRLPEALIIQLITTLSAPSIPAVDVDALTEENGHLREALQTAVDAIALYLAPSGVDGGAGECAAVTNAEHARRTVIAALSAPRPADREAVEAAGRPRSPADLAREKEQRVRAEAERDEAVKALAAARQTIIDLIHARGSEAEGSDEDWVGDIDDLLSRMGREEPQGARDE